MEWLLIVFLNFNNDVLSTTFQTKELCEEAREKISVFAKLRNNDHIAVRGLCVQKKLPKKEKK